MHEELSHILVLALQTSLYYAPIAFASANIVTDVPKGKRRPQLAVKIHRIFIGCNVDSSKKAHLKKIINALDKNIEIIMMHKTDLDYGFNR